MEALDKVRQWLGDRRYAYRKTFLHVHGDIVLADLAQFCRAGVSCFDADPRIHAVAEGRREVWLRIANQLNLTEDQLYALLTKSP